MLNFFKKASMLTALVAALIAPALTSYAHHSFAMYDTNKMYNFTGVVVRVSPNPAHLILFMSPLNEARDSVIRDENGEPVIWSVEMGSAGVEARNGISVNSFPRGTIISVGLRPLRNGEPAGNRGDSGLFKCPPNTPPAPGMHCDSVEGSTSHGDGVMLEPTGNPYPGI